jgi:hypothetical protein
VNRYRNSTFVDDNGIVDIWWHFSRGAINNSIWAAFMCGSADLRVIDALLVSVQRNRWNTVPLACFTWVFTLTPDSWSWRGQSKNGWL